LIFLYESKVKRKTEPTATINSRLTYYQPTLSLSLYSLSHNLSMPSAQDKIAELRERGRVYVAIAHAAGVEANVADARRAKLTPLPKLPHDKETIAKVRSIRSRYESIVRSSKALHAACVAKVKAMDRAIDEVSTRARKQQQEQKQQKKKSQRTRTKTTKSGGIKKKHRVSSSSSGSRRRR
jgi:hypothetical protein